MTKRVAPFVALALVAAACGGDDETVDPADDSTAEDSDADEGDADEGDTDEGDTDEGEADEGNAEADEGGTDEGDSDEGDAADGEITFDYGVTEDTIRIGLNADLSGAFAPLITPIVDAQEAYWEIVNDNGGIAGRQIELVIIDNAYDVPTHLANYAEMSDESDEGVVFFAHSTGSPHTTATAEDLVDDNLVAIPLSWYSGWPDNELGQNVMELYTNYCMESMNGVEFLKDTFGAETIAIISFPGEYGQDGATGAKIAAEELGLDLVYDGEGQVALGADQTPIITELVNAAPDIVWATTNPTTFAEIFGGAAAQGLQAQWSGNSPTYNFQLLSTELAPVLDQFYTHSTYTSLWGATESEGMTELIEGMRAQRPDAALSDYYIVGWTGAMATDAVLRQAAANGDMTRAGVVQAFNEVTVDFKGLSPDQEWFGEPNDFVVRESYIFDVTSDNYTEGATVSDEGAGTGFELLAGPYVGSIAENYDYQGPCFTG